MFGNFSALSGSLSASLQQIIATAQSLGICGGNPSPQPPLTTGSLGSFANIAFPLVKRAFGPALAPSLIQVQPMQMPSAGIFYQDYTYGDPMNDPKIKIFTFDEMIQAGIMPWESNTHDMNRLLSGLTPEESRKLRRKFRKLWRKKLAEKKNDLAGRVKNPDMAKRMASDEDKRLGKGQAKPTKEQRRRRREMLRDEFVKAARDRAHELKTNGEDPSSTR